MNEQLVISPTVLAVIAGEAMTEFPQDLFIPPDALTVMLEAFSGPLDLLCYLIRRQRLDILDIPITLITRQYMEYIHLLQAHRLELAADYLVMAAMLAEIKSRFLLPRSTLNEEEEEDPRLSLVRKLQAYEQMKDAASHLDALARCERDFFRIKINAPITDKVLVHPDVQLQSLVETMRALLTQQSLGEAHFVQQEALSVKERMSLVLDLLQEKKQLIFYKLWTKEEGLPGLLVSFLAILELASLSLIQIIQLTPASPIYLQAINDG